MRKFTALSAGLLVSVLGSAFTGLALAVWVFQTTGSVTQYGITLVLNFLPGILFAPVAGALVDRWNRRTILMVSDALNAVTVLALALLSMAGVLRLWHVFVVIGVGSLLRAIQMPALNSVVVLLAPKEHVGRANGMVLLAQAIGNTVGFAAGGVLLVAIGLFVAIPAPPRSAAGSADAGRLLGEIRQGWRYLSTRRVLVALIAFYAALQFTVGYVDALFTPLVLSFASAKALGLVVAFTGVGMLLGSVLLTTWGGPRRRIHGLAGFALPLGLFLFLGALRPSVPLIIVAALSFTLCFTVIDGTTRSVLQLEIEPDMQGRAFATFNMVTNAVLCASYALAGPIADHWFEPLLRAGGALADTVGAVIGVGPGRGMALLVLLFGVVVLATSVVAYLQPGLRNLPDRPAGGEAGEAEPAVVLSGAPPEG